MEIQKQVVKKAIVDWLLMLDKKEKLPKKIIALNFGLYEPYGIELIGSKKYDADNDDWACDEDFIPKQRNCPSIEISEDNDWETILTVVTGILKEIVAEFPTMKLLQIEHITTGFSDGDLIVIK